MHTYIHTAQFFYLNLLSLELRVATPRIYIRRAPGLRGFGGDIDYRSHYSPSSFACLVIYVRIRIGIVIHLVGGKKGRRLFFGIACYQIIFNFQLFNVTRELHVVKRGEAWGWGYYYYY